MNENIKGLKDRQNIQRPGEFTEGSGKREQHSNDRRIVDNLV